MNGLRNKVQLIGRLGQDPEVKTLESGKKVAHFNVATKESYKNAEGTKIDETTWHSIVAWNGLAELSSRFLSKGREVCIEGRIAYRSYTDKTGIQRNVTEIVATDLVMLSSGNRSRELISDETDVTSVVEPAADSDPVGRIGKNRGK
ncbi:MAG: single-stranded DNA-binding protein [Bacteroidales bacterium]|jgi:single-strand DNA-binding protein|nr:single-stranded DNA-binding protein [Bacteroidales bacterium]MDD3736813.1 single-stranded DNA-binding protein [Bacteroidales bacterium]NLD62957.1 single-stranded DNA-binding protein [Bacteroidales bacterium]HNT92135.1 single-stranded DNA-binding protein [Bacteroidales bacterium]HOO65601.1 single-stranded DNA-binding protein [Bacteroidales bacterium]